MRKFYLSLAGLAIVLGGILLLNVFNGAANAALPRDCDNNSIIYCGAGDVSELTQKYNENKTGDLATIYSSYGITSSMFASAKMGEVRKDGTVAVNGEVVATDVMSIGRQPIAGSTPKQIGGKTYYDSPPSTSFMSNSIAAFVFFDENGQFKGGIITSCGNAFNGKPKPKPKYACDGLVPAVITRTKYSFTANTSASGGAEIVSYAFDFGDGKTQTSTSKTIEHVYEKAGSYTAKVTVNVKVNGEVKPADGAKCQAPVAIKEAKYACDALTLRTLSTQKRQYAFDLAYTETDGAKLQTVDYDFGDGATKTGLTPAQAKTQEHVYAKAGSYTVKTTLHFSVDGSVKDAECQVSLTSTDEPCPYNPSLPKGDSRCQPPVTPPAELPKTGPMDMVFGGLGVSSIVAAGYYWFMSRRGLLDALLSR